MTTTSTKVLASLPPIAVLQPLLALALLALAPPPPVETPTGAPRFSAPTRITNAYAPFEAGAMKVYTGRSDGETLVVVDSFLHDTRVFVLNGVPVECVTLQETEFLDGELAEVSLNYFAQADDGTLYAFGEVVDDYEDGEVVAHDGSWLVGGPTQAGDAPTTGTALQPTVFMPAKPEVGDTWKPDDLFPIADETVTAKHTSLVLKVIAGLYADVLAVEETSELPDSETERKWYAPQVGVVKARSQGEHMQLASSTLTQH